MNQQSLVGSQCSFQVNSFKPFPVDALPKTSRDFVVNCAQSIGCDNTYVALPLLSVIAGLVGNLRRLRLKQGWDVPPIVWTVIVGESGSGKSPGYRAIRRLVDRLQDDALTAHQSALQKYERMKSEYDESLRRWRRAPEGERPCKPSVPPAPRLLVEDLTPEALAVILMENPNGVVLMSDELSGWLASFGRYGGSQRGDVSRWLSMHQGDSLVVDRKSDRQLIRVRRATVSICGGSPPGPLAKALRGELGDCGLAARILMAYPPFRAKKWTDAGVRPELESAIERMFDRLRELNPEFGDGDEPEPAMIYLSDEAKSVFVQFYNEHSQFAAELTGDLASMSYKIEEAAARLALVIFLARWAGGDSDNPSSMLDEESMRAGIELARWFRNEATRVYAIFDETDVERELRRLAEWIDSKGGSVTARELQQGQRRYRTIDEAEAALHRLADAELGCWEGRPPTTKGGRPTRVFRLY